MTERFEDSIFAVVAQQGEYSDYTTWIAAAYFSRNEAEQLAARLRADREVQDKAISEWQARRDEAMPEPTGFHDDYDAYFKRLSDWDRKNPGPSLTELGTSYSVLPIPIGQPGNYWPKP